MENYGEHTDRQMERQTKIEIDRWTDQGTGYCTDGWRDRQTNVDQVTAMIDRCRN